MSQKLHKQLRVDSFKIFLFFFSTIIQYRNLKYFVNGRVNMFMRDINIMVPSSPPPPPPGILKNVKDHIRECAQCQSKRSADDGSGPRPFSRQGRRKFGPLEDEDDDEEEDGEDILFSADLSSQRPKLAKGTTKHEVVYVRGRGCVCQKRESVALPAAFQQFALQSFLFSGEQQRRGEPVPAQTQPDHAGQTEPAAHQQPVL